MTTHTPDSVLVIGHNGFDIDSVPTHELFFAHEHRVLLSQFLTLTERGRRFHANRYWDLCMEVRRRLTFLWSSEWDFAYSVINSYREEVAASSSERFFE